MLSQIPAITWFAVSAHINGGLRGTLRAEARDDEGGQQPARRRARVPGAGQARSGAKPELQAVMQSLELGGTGKTVSLSFAVPAELFDVIGAAANHGKPAAH